jgi:hypothetical protein
VTRECTQLSVSRTQGGGGGDRRHGAAAGRGAHPVFASIAVARGCGRAAVTLELHAVGWKLVCGLEAQDFSDESLYMLFHVYLIHQSASLSVTVAHPAWLVVGVRDA